MGDAVLDIVRGERLKLLDMKIKFHFQYVTQSRRKCVIVASAMRAEQGPCQPIKGCMTHSQMFQKVESG